MNTEASVYIAGHNGMVGSAIHRNLKAKGFKHFITKSSSELDLRNQAAVNTFFDTEKPDYVFLAAARVGGIHANNTLRADFIYDNIMIQSNVIHAAHTSNVSKLLFLGSSCIYPKFAAQPMNEAALLTGELEPTNEPYAIAKIAGVKMCDAYRSQHGRDFISVMPTNLYGPNDNYDLNKSHVLPALLRKFHTASKNNDPEVVMWGTGSPKREFMHVDDLAEACIYLMDNYSEPGVVNIGTGEEVSIFELAQKISQITDYQGVITKDLSKPDGTPRKLMDVSLLHNLGFKHKISLDEGINSVYKSLKDKPWY
jgi:GDP-L-fucose synthase